ncbi:autotransporter domain-containing protein [Streptobacillus canis]|uniref:autotransporter domain-containing protein n=1 Tax=Streptobacillus canis TaxID=2678686 RepID=UPI0012E10C00|nr:autotransporter domain-containing protein [Streptobacillus canis]
MNIYKRLAVVTLGVSALLSCSSIQKENIGKQDSVLEFSFTDKQISKESKDKLDSIIENKELNILDYYDANNFKFNGSYLYQGETLHLNKKIAQNVIVESVKAKNPVIVIDENDKRYSKYTENIDGKIKVENIENNKKRITFLNQNAAYITLRDNKGNTREIMLNQSVDIVKSPTIENGTRYRDLKKGYDNGRISYQVLTNNGGYEDKKYLEDLKKNPLLKYSDLDDLVGIKGVEIEDSLGNKVTKNIDFGIKLSDYKDKYEEILTDLDKTTLKFSKDGKTVTGGFNPDIVEKLSRYEESTSKGNSSLEFVTEILDKDKTKIGKHKVARKILRNGVEIYRKEELAYVGFYGTTVAVADSSFYNVSPEVEARLIRMRPKGTDTNKENADDKFIDLDRPHGEVVIGSMIDEIATSERQFLTSAINAGALKGLLALGAKRDLELVSGNDDLLIKQIENQYRLFLTRSAAFLDSELFYGRARTFKEKIDDYSNLKEEIKKLPEEEKVNKLKEYYNQALDLLEDVIAIDEVSKLGATDLHFKAIAIENSQGGLEPGIVGKYLNKILEDDKNVKAINMSYGSEYSYEEYIAIRDMSLEDKKRAVAAYNDPDNAEFRVAVQTWLADNDFGDISRYEEHYPGELNIPSMLNYFRNKEKITVTDYQKLLDLRMLSLSQVLKSAAELIASNKDVLMVRAQGNTLNNSNSTEVDLINFNSDGTKTKYLDGNRKYNNPFTSLPSYLNEKDRERAEAEGKEYKYNYNYRKNLLGVIGLADKRLTTGSGATEDISEVFGLNTSTSGGLYNKLRGFVHYQDSYYQMLRETLEDIKRNPDKYPKGYEEEIKVQIATIDRNSELETEDIDGRPFLMSFTRAGAAKLWTVAGEGMVTYIKKLTEEEKKYKEKSKDRGELIEFDTLGLNLFESGSSFSAPRITAIAGEIGTKFPWMSAQQIKQTILTTALDDARFKRNQEGNAVIVGLYGPDENIGWGISNKEMAYRGPARFVRALTLETGDEDFVANIPYGTYTFGNDIAGALDPYLYMYTRKALTGTEFLALNTTKDLTFEEILDPSFDTNEKTRKLAELLKEAKVTKADYFAKLYKKVDKYMDELPEDERELFVDAGLVKKGNGTLVLSGSNTYTDPTIVEAGTLILRGDSKSPFVVHRDAKLKLDMINLEAIKNTLLDDDEEEYRAKIDADVINRGELYSYSTADRIDGSYTPLDGSRTYIAAIANLQVNELNLDDTSRFNFNIFRKKGMNIFKTPELIDPDTKPKKDELEGIISANNDEKEVLSVSKIAKKNLGKVKLGTFEYTPFVSLEVSTKDIEDDSENVSLVAKLIRKNKIAPLSLGARFRNRVIDSLETAVDKEKVNTDLNNLDWMSENELNGEILANSQLLGYKLLEKKNKTLKERLELKGKEKKISIFTDSINEAQFKFNKEKDKFIISNGFILGGYYTSKYNVTGLSLNYSNSVLFDYKLGLEENKDPIRTDLSEEERKIELEKRKVEELSGNVYGNNVGLSIYNKFDYNKGYLTSLFNIDYLTKNTVRKIESRDVKNYESSDIILNANLEGGYKFKLLNDKLDVEPFVSTDLITYIKGSFNENREFGYSSDSETFFKANTTLGARVRGYINEKGSIGANISYTKYLTDTLLKSKVELKEYEFKDTAKGLKLDDNVFNYGIDGRYNINDKFELKVSYQGRNLRSHGISLGIRAEW